MARTRDIIDVTPGRKSYSTYSTVEDRSRTETMESLEKLSSLLDARWTVPGTTFKFGLDPIIGLLPGVGDSLSLALSAYIIMQGSQLGLSRFALARMIGNATLDAIIGVVPLVGDLADFGFKANRRNIDIIKKELGVNRVVTGTDPQKNIGQAILILAAGLLALLVAAITAISLFFVSLIS